MTQESALNILKTGANVFLTGEPGAGKTYVVNSYVNYLRSSGVEPAITASTGIAATHIGGMTIHSWSGIGIRTKLDKYDLDKIASSEYIAKRINRTRVLIIDEISMLSVNMLDMIDMVCREVRQNSEAFGGMQIVLVGDFFQLPPFVKRNNLEKNQLENKNLFLEEETKSFMMSGTGNDNVVAALKKGCLSPENLELKIGAVVMCTKNNPKERFVKIGRASCRERV